MQENGRTLPDGTHELIVHKVSSVGNERETSFNEKKILQITRTALRFW